MSNAYKYPFPNVSEGFFDLKGNVYRVIVHANTIIFLFDKVPFRYSRFDTDVVIKMHKDKIQQCDFNKIIKMAKEYSFLSDKKTSNNEQMSLF